MNNHRYSGLKISHHRYLSNSMYLSYGKGIHPLCGPQNSRLPCTLAAESFFFFFHWERGISLKNSNWVLCGKLFPVHCDNHTGSSNHKLIKPRPSRGTWWIPRPVLGVLSTLCFSHQNPSALSYQPALSSKMNCTFCQWEEMMSLNQATQRSSRRHPGHFPARKVRIAFGAASCHEHPLGDCRHHAQHSLFPIHCIFL